MAEQIKILFGVNTPGGPWNIVLDGVMIPHREGSRDILFEFWDPLISHERLKLESPVHAVWVVHSMPPLPNHFGFLFNSGYRLACCVCFCLLDVCVIFCFSLIVSFIPAECRERLVSEMTWYVLRGLSDPLALSNETNGCHVTLRYG